MVSDSKSFFALSFVKSESIRLSRLPCSRHSTHSGIYPRYAYHIIGYVLRSIPSWPWRLDGVESIRLRTAAKSLGVYNIFRGFGSVLRSSDYVGIGYPTLLYVVGRESWQIGPAHPTFLVCWRSDLAYYRVTVRFTCLPIRL